MMKYVSTNHITLISTHPNDKLPYSHLIHISWHFCIVMNGLEKKMPLCNQELHNILRPVYAFVVLRRRPFKNVTM
jgi:hypothetical protein